MIRLLLLITFICSIQSKDIVPAANLVATTYGDWAHKHWVWLHNSDGNQANVTNMIDQYLSHGIPVGGINIDSTWETQYNNFIIDTSRFPDTKGMIEAIHAKDIKVIFWITSMVNVENTEDYDEALANGYLLRNKWGKVRPMQWWHGEGALLDYTNPAAVDWWHAKLDLLLDLGVDGWKVDGVDPYILEYIGAGGALGYNDQLITYREYADLYYSDYFDYTRSKRGIDGLIMSRPVDCMLDRSASFCWGYSPKKVMVSGWVGDDDGTFEGLRGCIKKVIYSAWDGYANFGSDTGGYREPDEPNKEVFLRWAQLNSFLPLLENGGGGVHFPWLYDDETTFVYKKFVEEHHSLVPYLITTGMNALEMGVSSVTPLASRDDDVHFGKKDGYPEPRSFAYLLGKDLFVHPIVWAFNSTTVSVVDILFPEGEETVWLDYWHPNDEDKVYKGTERHIRDYLLNSYPVFVRQNALIALHNSDEDLFFKWYKPVSNDIVVTSEYRQDISVGTGVVATSQYISSSNSISLTISSASIKSGFVVVGITKPVDVDIQSHILSLCTHFYVDYTSSLHIECQNIEGGVIVTVQL